MARSLIHSSDRSQSTMRSVPIRALVLGCVALACAAGTGSAPIALGLTGTHWTLIGLGEGAVPIAKTQTEPFLVFGDPPDHVHGSGGCNRLAGGYLLDGASLRFGPIAATRMACADGMDVEAALSAALGRTSSHRIEGDRLELYDADARVLATFAGRAAD
jgi:putative lipoprotein